ncbi:hypothetical protein A3D11_00855 [Candidatus Peribacteria bacterium RIFCSPHIGHO2_02_FULL_49_16]|nr:MAG: hypothetical protein A2880_01280 [Candidatus Peribacteria bacterium RIFCSPHIGHO2_01_FULL_49_38]OGJ60076.1 MAG: hypothetical protein A3D11_00855 [Candidatus Peribacteria bacterium RIFCSPHIGHO2_02_FULL_49_16]
MKFKLNEQSAWLILLALNGIYLTLNYPIIAFFTTVFAVIAFIGSNSKIVIPLDKKIINAVRKFIDYDFKFKRVAMFILSLLSAHNLLSFFNFRLTYGKRG